MTRDLLDELAGITPGSDLDTLRALRPDIRAASAACEAAIFAAPSGLTTGERHAVALHVAALHECAELAEHHRHLAAASPRLPAMLAHAEKLSLRPHEASRAALASLDLSPAEIVMLSQLIAYIAWQARALHGLKLLAGEAMPGAATPPAPSGGTADFGFTIDTLGWNAWVPVLDLAQATPDQLKVLEESHPKAKTSDYYLLLVQEPEVLRQRSKLFNTIMYGPRGASRAERELAAAAESRLNGCPYCLSVHAQRYVQLKGDPRLMQRLVEEGVEATMDPRSRAITDLSVKLSHTPATAGAADLDKLRALDMPDDEILDIINAVAMFAWANRLMQTLGEPVR
jgi:uncharacterized peroxidase-related enzyme